MKLTQGLIRELVHYNSYTGDITWRERARKWFNSDAAWRRWNNRYANTPAFAYAAKGYRWGSIFDKNYLAHRVVWLYVHGRWPHVITFRDCDGTNLKLDNLIELQPNKAPRVRFTMRTPRERLPITLAA